MFRPFANKKRALFVTDSDPMSLKLPVIRDHHSFLVVDPLVAGAPAKPDLSTQFRQGIEARPLRIWLVTIE